MVVESVFGEPVYIYSLKEGINSTSFSEFIRNASSREKKRVYTDVLKKATDRQTAIIRKACSAK